MRGVPRIPEPWEWVKTKRCTHCGETKPWSWFSPKGYHDDGSVRKVASRCKPCATRLQRPVPEHRRDRVNAYKADWARRQRDELRAETASWTGPRLPVEPFKAWLLDRIDEYGSMLLAAEAMGASDRSLRRVLRQNERVSLSLVDRCLTRLGWHLNDLYGDVEEAA